MQGTPGEQKARTGRVLIAMDDAGDQLTAHRRRARPPRSKNRVKPLKWTPQEDDLLREMFSRIPAAELALKLPGRTVHAIRTRAHSLGLSKPRKWTMADTELLIAHRDMRETWATLIPGRNYLAVARMASRLGLAHKHLESYWTADEIKILRQIASLRDRLTPRRSMESIHRKSRELVEADQFYATAIAACKAAVPTNHPAEIRDEVLQTLLVRLLGKEITLADIPAAAKKALTAAYGPQMYSLDAPLSDGSSMTWKDTIDNDHARF